MASEGLKVLRSSIFVGFLEVQIKPRGTLKIRNIDRPVEQIGIHR
jgi:hypothetical protein